MAKEASRKLKTLISPEERKGLDLEMVTLSGSPFLEIIRYAKENGVDMIVIGTAGRSGVEHMMFGSTAEKVVRKAHCPVLCVKPASAE
jgi:universal stress protein A